MISHGLRLLKREREEAIRGIQQGLEDAKAGRVQPLDEAFGEIRPKLVFLPTNDFQLPLQLPPRNANTPASTARNSRPATTIIARSSHVRFSRSLTT